MTSNPLVKSAIILFEVVIGALLLAGAVVVIAGFVPVSHPWITRKAVGLIARSGVDSCSIGSMRTAVWKSTTLQKVTLVVFPDSVTRCTMYADKISINANMPYLFWTMRHDASTILAILPRLLVNKRTGQNENNLRRVSRYLSRISQGTIQGVTITVTRKGAEIVKGLDGSIELSQSSSDNSGQKLNGTFTMLNLYGEVFEKGSVTVSLTPKNAINVERCTARYFDGTVNARMTLEPENNRISDGELTINNLDLAYWYSVHSKVGKITGIVDLRLSGQNVPLRWPLVNSTLECAIQKCRLSELPIQQSLATSLFIPTLSALEFSKVSISATADTSDTVVTSFYGTGEQLDFSAGGWVITNGTINQKLEGTFSAKTARTFPPVVNRTLEVAKNGGRTFRCRLFGTFSDPRFELDKEMLRRAVGNLFEDFRQELMRQYQVR
jgi:hypothetical protein